MKKWLFSIGISFAALCLLTLLSVPVTSKLQQDSREKFIAEHPVDADTLYISINKVRSGNQLPQFKRNALLDKSAKLKCKDMVVDNYYEHKDPVTGQEGYKYVDKTYGQYEWVSENLNAGVFYSPEEVVDSWMGSPSHAASILDPRFTEIGFATCEIAKYPGETVIVQHKVDPL